MPELQVSAIVPARNEEANIAGAVESLAAQTVPLEIIVVNDASTDRTGSILAELQQRLPQLKVGETGELPAGWGGGGRRPRAGGSPPPPPPPPPPRGGGGGGGGGRASPAPPWSRIRPT